MDGAAADADLLFVLTTNRADLLEPAASRPRPGRVDVAVEIDLPDSDAGRVCSRWYSRSLPLAPHDSEIADIVQRTDGL